MLHSLQASEDEAALVADHVPLSQFSQSESLTLPVLVEYFPGTQAVQTLSNVFATPSASLYRPTSQLLQPSFVSPFLSLYLPGSLN